MLFLLLPPMVIRSQFAYSQMSRLYVAEVTAPRSAGFALSAGQGLLHQGLGQLAVPARSAAVSPFEDGKVLESRTPGVVTKRCEGSFYAPWSVNNSSTASACEVLTL